MTQPLPPSDKHEDRDDRMGLNWARITGISFVIAVHAAALLLLLAPVTPPLPPPPEPPVVFDEPSPMDTQAPPPAPPAPTAPAVPSRNSSDLRAALCTKPSMGPLIRALAQSGSSSAELSLRIAFTADGSITSVSIAKSSRNRDLDRAAQSWARGAKLCPGAPGEGILPFSFSLSG